MRGLLLAALLVLPVVLPPAAAPGVSIVGALPEPLTGIGAATIGPHVYLASGANGSTYSARILRFDPASRAVEEVATLPATPGATHPGRTGAAVFALAGKLYVAGGAVRIPAEPPTWVPIRSIADIVEFDPATRQTRVLPDALPAARHGAAVAVFGGRAYLFGGTSHEPSDALGRQVLVFDPARPEGSRVREAATLPARFQDTRAVALDDAILLLGGTVSGSGEWACPASGNVTPTVCQTGAIARFDPATGETRIVARLATPATHVEAERVGGSVHILGGIGQNLASVNASRFDVAASTLHPAPTVANATGMAGVAVVGDVIYLFGGRPQGRSVPLDPIRAFDPASRGGPVLALVARPDGNTTRVSWEAPLDGAGPYVVERVDAQGNVTRVYEGNATSVNDTLPAGDAVRYRVRTGSGALASLVETRAVGGAAPPPALDAAAWLAQGRARLTWTATANATAIHVYREGALAATLAPDARAYDDGAPAPVYHVRALAGDRESEPGPALAPRALPPPTALDARLVPRAERTSYDLLVTWNASGWSDHEALAGPREDALAPLGRTNDSAWTIPRVAPGSATFVSARSVLGDLTGEPLPARRVDAPPAPRAPGSLTIRGEEARVTLTWEETARSDETYTLWRTGADGVERALAQRLVNSVYLDFDVEAGTVYSYRVTTEGTLRSGYSAEVRAAVGPDEVVDPTPPPSTTPAPARTTPASAVTPSPTATVPTPTPEPSAPPSPTPSPTATVPPPPPPSNATPAPGAALAVLALVALARLRRR